MKILFLDIDGVLNSSRSFEALINNVEPGQDDWHAKLTRGTIDPVAVGMVNSITASCRADIVVSSSHRQYFTGDLPGMTKYLRSFGITGNVIDMTPVLYKDRGHEIENWIATNGAELKSYLILDDDADMLDSQLQNFVQTCWKDGMSFDHYKKAIEILSVGIIVQPYTDHVRVAS